MRAFPQELIDKVIDCSAGQSSDADTMKTYGLLCKACVPRSRYHLFSTVTLTAKNLHSLIDLIETSSTHLLHFFRRLKLRYEGRPLDAMHLTRLHCCPNLTSLSIEVGSSQSGAGLSPIAWLNSDEYLHTHIRSWAANAVALLRFDLQFGAAPFTLSTMVKLLSCVPSVETVGIHASDDEIEDTDQYGYPSYTPTRLTQLSVNVPVLFSDSPCILRWLLALPELPMLKSLKYGGELCFGPTLQALKAFIQRAGCELESLSLQVFDPHESERTTLIKHILPYTTKLRNLSFICEDPTEILDILLLLPSSMNSLAVAMFQHKSDQGPLWHKIDEALLEFHTLQEFSVSSETRPRMTLSKARELLPLADARGIVAEPPDSGIRVGRGLLDDDDLVL
ncbi:hypothetical protein B0H19DRAFT_1155120 [Mycena capillaripes]|nr:hypothetical protein B0H19DRAFT_1155120 [Mycena capillaripes]